MLISSTIINLFGRSPIKPLQKHMNVACQAANHLVPFFNAVLASDWNAAKAAQKRIRQLENEADELKKDLRLHLPNSLFLPVSRTDLLELLTIQDKIANTAKDIAGLVLGRKMQIPEVIADSLIKFTQCSIEAAAQAEKAINEIDELLETGFKGSEVTLVENMIIKLDQLEHDNDKMQITLREQLFSIENDLNPIDAMFLYKTLDRIGDLADRAQTVGAHLQILMAN